MNGSFIREDFLLESPQASALYHEVAESLPIIDYHCHLSPAYIAGNRKFSSLTEAWLDGDHYKWRAMRTCGVDEAFITGNASPWEKFAKWAEVVPLTLRNPLYHWTHLELRRPFGITDRLLSPATAKSIWEECNTKLATPDFGARGILRQMRVEIVCTSDDPVDTLEHHIAFAAVPGSGLRMHPTFRPDKTMAVESPAGFAEYVGQLGKSSGVSITGYDSFLDAIHRRHTFFHDHGCRASDHGIEEAYADECTASEVRPLFEKLLKKQPLDREGVRKFKSAVLHELALMNAERGWVQQFHVGALRNTNSRMMRQLGPDTGYDSIGDFPLASNLARFLDKLDSGDKLAKTVLYNLNPRDNELFATMIGNFQGGTIAGKLQYGSAWWFLDQIDGMTRQIVALSAMGLLSQFIGMVTDSRSFLSFPRHEYFRRILCNILGEDMRRGLVPDDLELVGTMVRGIAYENVKRYLALPATLHG